MRKTVSVILVLVMLMAGFPAEGVLCKRTSGRLRRNRSIVGGSFSRGGDWECQILCDKAAQCEMEP